MTPSPASELPGAIATRGRAIVCNDGRLLLYSARDPAVQVMEAEGTAAYAPLASTYRRLLALVDDGAGGAYVLDVFRVEGGSRHDWLLHGALQEHYDPVPKVADSVCREKVGPYIQTQVSLAPSFIGFRYHDGLETRLWPLWPDPSKDAKTNLLFGRAPAIRRSGTALFIDWQSRKRTTVYVAVHEVTGKGGSAIRHVKLIGSAGLADTVAVAVELANGRQDLLLCGLDEKSTTAVRWAGSAVRQTGHFGYVSYDKHGLSKMVLIDGRDLEVGKRSLHGLPAAKGIVRGVLRRETGDAENAFLVAEEPSWWEHRSRRYDCH